jgi:hypothetical protein
VTAGLLPEKTRSNPDFDGLVGACEINGETIAQELERHPNATGSLVQNSARGFVPPEPPNCTSRYSATAAGVSGRLSVGKPRRDGFIVPKMTYSIWLILTRLHTNSGIGDAFSRQPGEIYLRLIPRSGVWEAVQLSIEGSSDRAGIVRIRKKVTAERGQRKAMNLQTTPSSPSSARPTRANCPSQYGASPQRAPLAIREFCTTLNYISRKTTWKIPIDTGILKIVHSAVSH